MVAGRRTINAEKIVTIFLVWPLSPLTDQASEFSATARARFPSSGAQSLVDDIDRQVLETGNGFRGMTLSKELKQITFLLRQAVKLLGHG